MRRIQDLFQESITDYCEERDNSERNVQEVKPKRKGVVTVNSIGVTMVYFKVYEAFN